MPRRTASGAAPDYAPVYTDTLELDMGTIVPAISGPKRPQDYLALDRAANAFKVVAEYRGVDIMEAREMAAEGPAPTAPLDPRKAVAVEGEDYALRDG